MIYMDNAAAERPLQAAVTAASSVWDSTYANPNSIHSFGQEAKDVLESARNEIAELMNCLPDEVHFCSCACEAASWALKSMRSVCYGISVGKFEHDCVLEAAKNTGYGVYSAWESEKIGAVSMLANNETGEIYKISRGSVLRFVDATAAVGQIPVDFRALGCDYLCADAMKFGGLPGAAFLIVRRRSPMIPLIYGNEERGGTPPTALISAMATALRIKTRGMGRAIQKTVQMRDYMIDELLKLPDSHLNGPRSLGTVAARLPGNVNISFGGVDGTALGLMLSARGLMVSTGSACTSGNNEPSHVLLAMGVSPELARGAVRITLNEYNTMEECHQAVRMIKECVFRLRDL